jgi:hypothetical protein
LGSHDVSSTNEPHRETLVVSAGNIKTYPGYYYGKIEDDVALLELPQEINFSSKLNKIFIEIYSSIYSMKFKTKINMCRIYLTGLSPVFG